MLDVLFNHLLEIVVGAVSTLAVALWGYLALAFKRSDTRIHEFTAIPKEIKHLGENLETTKIKMTSMQATLTDLHLEIKARGDLNIDAAEFTCDSDGLITSVNQTYARWLGVGKLELDGLKWLNYVHPDDVERVRKDWEACMSDHRGYNGHYRLVDIDGDVIYVHAVASPIPDSPPARQWVGVIRKEAKPK